MSAPEAIGYIGNDYLGKVRARLSRGKHVYATGTSTSRGLRLTAKRHLAAGTYKLILFGRNGATVLTAVSAPAMVTYRRRLHRAPAARVARLSSGQAAGRGATLAVVG